MGLLLDRLEKDADLSKRREVVLVERARRGSGDAENCAARPQADRDGEARDRAVVVLEESDVEGKVTYRRSVELEFPATAQEDGIRFGRRPKICGGGAERELGQISQALQRFDTCRIRVDRDFGREAADGFD